MANFEKGISLYKEGKFEEALKVFNDLIIGNPSETEFLLYRGRIRSRLGRLEEALVDFDQLIAIDGKNTNFISDRAVVLHLLKRNDEALSAFDYAIKLDSNNPYRYSSRAYLRDRLGDFKGSIIDYERAIELDPEDAVAYNNKGIVEDKLGYQNRAKESLRRADELAGYQPRETAIPQENGKLPEVGNQKEQEVMQEKSLANTYIDTLKKVFTDKNTRDEFIDFIFKGGKKR